MSEGVEKAQWEVGDHLEATWEDGNFYRIEINEVLPDNKGYEVTFIEYGEKATVTHDQTRPLQGLLPINSGELVASSQPHTRDRTASTVFDYTLKGLRKRPVAEGVGREALCLTSLLCNRLRSPRFLSREALKGPPT